jgi:hypothetical protein
MKRGTCSIQKREVCKQAKRKGRKKDRTHEPLYQRVRARPVTMGDMRDRRCDTLKGERFCTGAHLALKHGMSHFERYSDATSQIIDQAQCINGLPD